MNRIVILLTWISISFLNSCSLFSPRKDFERHLRSENRCNVTFWKATDGTDKITTEIDYPNKKSIYVDGADLSKVLTETQINQATYLYVGDWDESEKKIDQNFYQEYQKWFSARGNN